MPDYERAVKTLIRVPDDMPPEKEWKQFDVPDVYNPGNTLTGFLSRRSTRFYCALLLSHVNGKQLFHSQLIFCTPKLHYPFDKHGRYVFPKALQIQVYDKLDGTNILCYSYRDVQGDRFYTFKSRLTPVLRDSTLVSFTDLLKATGRQEQARDLTRRACCNLSFELWGARNLHLIKYDKPIELSLLFAVDEHGRVFPPDAVGIPHEIPVTHQYPRVAGQYVETYNCHRLEDEAKIKATDEGYTGTEGRVWYMKTEDMAWRQFKCKPDTVEQIHWSASKGITINIIRATAMNVLETEDDITLAAVNTLLREEFDDYDVLSAKKRIERVIETIRLETVFRTHVLEEYDRLGLNLNEDKALTMRALSKVFEKKYMRHVYFIVKAHRS